jgi:SAM-dependent methyltransferase
VNQRELETVERLLEPVPHGGRVLDLASGTGRLARYLRERTSPGEPDRTPRYEVFALDFSRLMIERTVGASAVQGDAFTLPFGDATLDAVVALRFAFHWEDLDALFAETARVACPGAAIVFDTYVWTPRSVLAIGAAQWGSKVFTHSPASVRAVSTRLGLTVGEEEHGFICSPYVYRLMPLSLQRTAERLERALPESWLCRVFWQLRKPA